MVHFMTGSALYIEAKEELLTQTSENTGDSTLVPQN